MEDRKVGKFHLTSALKIHMSLRFTSHWLELVTLPCLNYSFCIEKWKSITIPVTCNKIIENKGQFNIKFKIVFTLAGEGSAQERKSQEGINSNLQYSNP